MTTDYAARAEALVGVRFRLQGRGEEGLDCVGVVLATFDLPPDAVRRNYRLRGDHLQEACEALDLHFERVPPGSPEPGDVIMVAPGDRQVHLAVRSRGGCVHAHAGIGRVVETPGMPSGPLLGVYRKREER